MKVKLSLIIFTIYMTGCAHVTHGITPENKKEAVKITSDEQQFYINFGWSDWSSGIYKIYDLKGNVIVDKNIRGTYGSVTLKQGKMKVLASCSKSNARVFKNIVIDTVAGKEYILKCKDGSVKGDAVVIISETKNI